jgi:hypothetical protein
MKQRNQDITGHGSSLKQQVDMNVENQIVKS